MTYDTTGSTNRLVKALGICFYNPIQPMLIYIIYFYYFYNFFLVIVLDILMNHSKRNPAKHEKMS